MFNYRLTQAGALALLLILLATAVTQTTRPSLSAAGGGETGPDYGVVFITSAEGAADEGQFQNGLATGAGWDRWPIYWFNVESSPGVFDWSGQDAAVLGDIAHGLQTNAILLGTPPFYTTGAPSHVPTQPPPPGRLALQAPQTATPQGLYEPIFDDGTDLPGPGKGINPANKWALFVETAVNRYKPGGVLAQTHGWPPGVGVTHWEMWNEPDLTLFWDGTLPDYARLLKVGYLVAHQADPAAQVLFGGLANNFDWLSFYDEVLAVYDADPLAAAHNRFHDILAMHSYFYAWRSWFHVDQATQALAARGLSKPIWLNESGVPAWDDYPGPVWDPSSPLRATMSEQADYTIQSALYARYAGADAIFHFQLYDGCGNQPAGTDFPPHNGELCTEDGRLITDPRFPCAGDANGLFRNPTDAACFTQHPSPESPRPIFDAFQTLTTYFADVEPLWWQTPGDQDWLAFVRADAGQRIVGLWALEGEVETAVVPATGNEATLLTPDGAAQTLAPVNGVYTLTLPAATNQNAFWDPTLYPIGGRPFLLIEVDTIPPTVTASAPPFAYLSVVVNWGGDDGLGVGMGEYDVFVAVDGGTAVPWLTATTATSGAYPLEPDHTYTFTVVGRDLAGNAGPPVTLTVESLLLDQHSYLPAIARSQ